MQGPKERYLLGQNETKPAHFQRHSKTTLERKQPLNGEKRWRMRRKANFQGVQSFVVIVLSLFCCF